MKLDEGIREHGFRKWYERELMRSHGHLVLLIACAIGLMTSFAVYSGGAPLAERALDVAAIMLFAGVGQWSLRRFFFLLMHAESVANQAVCSACQTYGRLMLAQGSGRRGDSLLVRCKKCAHEWTIVD
jgi:predicted Zn finger-like uncharacterized protein